MKNINKRIQQLEEKIRQVEDINNPYGEHMSHCLLRKNGKLYVNNNVEWTDELRNKHPKHKNCIFLIMDVFNDLKIDI